MKNRLFFFLLFLLLLCSSSTSIQLPPVPEKNISLVEKLAAAFLQKTKLPGLSIAVSKKGKIIYAKGFGYADVESKIPMTPYSQLRTASVAKVITATALGRLVTENKLDLDAPIKNYIPYIDSKYADITSRQLAGHTAGLTHRPKGNRYKKKQYTHIQSSVALIKAPLLFAPDTQYEYSTSGYNLLAAVIEGASNMRYVNYLEQFLFEPLHMTQTAPENIKQLSDKDAQVYWFKKNRLKKEKLTNASYKLAGAGFRSTPSDLVTMMNAYNNRIISEEVEQEMFRSHQLKNGEATNVGIAWRPSYDAFGHALVDHAGSWRGARSVVVYYPEEDLSIALMINASCQIFIEESAHIFAQLFRDYEPVEFMKEPINQQLKIVVNSQGKETQYKGQLIWNGTSGVIHVDTDGFLQSNPIYYLGMDNHYALVSSYGLLYLNLETTPLVNGKLYLYANRNKEQPTKQKALATFKSID